jgi:hypothetical protein
MRTTRAAIRRALRRSNARSLDAPRPLEGSAVKWMRSGAFPPPLWGEDQGGGSPRYSKRSGSKGQISTIRAPLTPARPHHRAFRRTPVSRRALGGRVRKPAGHSTKVRNALEICFREHPGDEVVSNGVSRADRPVRFAKGVHLRRPCRIVRHREVSLTQMG